MTDSVVVEGYARLRDGKKVLSLTNFAGQNYFFNDVLLNFLCFSPLPQWKTRWLVLRKPSPVAGNLFHALAFLIVERLVASTFGTCPLRHAD